jgi:chromosome segregation ATPase
MIGVDTLCPDRARRSKMSEDSKNRINAVETKIEGLEAQTSTLETTIDSLLATVASLRETLEAVQATLRESKVEIAAIKAESDPVELPVITDEEIQSLEESVSMFEDERLALYGAIDDYNDKLSELKDAWSSVETCKGDYNVCRDYLDRALSPLQERLTSFNSDPKPEGWSESERGEAWADYSARFTDIEIPEESDIDEPQAACYADDSELDQYEFSESEVGVNFPDCDLPEILQAAEVKEPETVKDSTA